MSDDPDSGPDAGHGRDHGPADDPHSDSAPGPDADPAPGTADSSPPMSETTDTPDPTTGTATDDTTDLVRYARYALLGGLTLLALVATLRFYFAASNAIDVWVAREYRPLFQAAFNLVVLLVAAIGISWELRQVARSR